MSNVRQMLTERLRREIEEARSGYESQPYKHAVYRLNETEWFSVAARELHKENQEAPQATLAEMLDVLTEHTEHLADREARQIERTMDALGIEHASLTEKTLAELVHSWPWSSGAPFHGSTKDMAPMLLDEITKQPGKKPNSVELRELYQWARESIDSLPTEKPRATLGWVSNEHYGPMAVYLSGLSNNAEAPPIHDRHLLALYVATVPEGVRYARSFFHLLERVASGDAYRYLFERVAPDALTECKANDTQSARELLSPAIIKHARQLSDALAFSIPKDAAAADALALELYERSATYFEKLGSDGKRTADGYREKAIERGDKTTAEKWTPWRHDGDAVPRWLHRLACVVWIDELERERNSPRRLQISGATDKNGDTWAGIPKTVASLAWAFGGQGVVVDGDRYATEPGVAVLLPRTHALLSQEFPGHEKRPHQTAFPIGYDEAEPSLAVVVADASKYAISTLATKVCFVFFGDDNIKHGHVVTATLGDLARELYPTAPRIQKRDLANVSKALDELRRLFMVFPRGPKVQLFDIGSPSGQQTTEHNAEISVTIGLLFRHYALTNPTAELGSGFNGYFLANHSALMRIPATRPDALRLSVRGSAGINAAFNPVTKKFDRNFAQRLTLKQLGAIANTLPPGAYEANGLKRAPKKETYDARKGILETLEYLRDEARALDFETQGRGEHQTVLILPTEGYSEAKAQIAKSGTRPRVEQRGRR